MGTFKLERYSFAIGIFFGLFVLGCLVAQTNGPDSGNANTGWRYEFVQPVGTGTTLSHYAIFDRQSGTANIVSLSHGTVTVHNFQP